MICLWACSMKKNKCDKKGESGLEGSGTILSSESRITLTSTFQEFQEIHEPQREGEDHPDHECHPNQNHQTMGAAQSQQNHSYILSHLKNFQYGPRALRVGMTKN